MEWKILDWNVLDSLKTGHAILVKERLNYETPYDVVKFLDSKKYNLYGEEIKNHWGSIANEDRRYSFDDETLLEIFSHYYIIDDSKN